MALYNLLPEDERFDRVLALCTDDARGTFRELERDLPIPAERVDMPGGAGIDDLQTAVHCILERIPEGTSLTLDLTHGFRHYPFLFFAACLYLMALKDVKIEGVWYGRLDGKKHDGTAPFVDLRILLEMVDWFRAVQSFRDMSNPQALAKKLLEYKRRNKSDWNPAAKKNYSAFSSAADDFAEFFGMGLPAELGMRAAHLEESIEKLLNEGDLSGMGIPLAEDLLLEMKKAAERFKLRDLREKKDLVLDIREIHRQRDLIDAYLEAGYYNNAIGLMRELVISRLMLAGDGEKDYWLDRSRRKNVERRIGALESHSRNSSAELPEERRKLADIWSTIIRVRNALHHHGMTKEKISREERRISECWNDLKSRLDDDSFWVCDFGGGSGRLLISPLGLHPGFLYTVLRKEDPETCLVVASHESVGRWYELSRNAGYRGDFKILEMNAHSFEDIRGIGDRCGKLLVGFDEVVCNLTGGTAAMQYAVIQLARRAEHLGRSVRWVAAIDDRSPEEQRLEPYIEGRVERLEDVRI